MGQGLAPGYISLRCEKKFRVSCHIQSSRWSLEFLFWSQSDVTCCALYPQPLLFSISLSARATLFYQQMHYLVGPLLPRERWTPSSTRLWLRAALWRLWQMVVAVARRPSASWLLVPWGSADVSAARSWCKGFSQEAEGCLAHLPLG